MTDKTNTEALAQENRAELLPCPFCGSPNVTLEHVGSTAYEAFCEFCGASGPCDSEQWRTVKGWNARALPAGVTPVAGQSRFVGEVEWRACTVEHVRMVLAAPQDWQGYEVRDLYAAAPRPPAAQEPVQAVNQQLTTDETPFGYLVGNLPNGNFEVQKAVPTLAQQVCGNCAPVYSMPSRPTAQERKPLTDEQIRKWWASENGLEDCDMAKVVDFEQMVRAVEAVHGITGGSDGIEPG